MLIKDAEKQMEQRGVVSDKQMLITSLEKAFIKAISEKDFYNILTSENLELYTRNNTIVGVKLKRKFRFKTLGYSKIILQELDKKPPKNKRLETLKRIRKSQLEHNKGRERTKRETH